MASAPMVPWLLPLVVVVLGAAVYVAARGSTAETRRPLAATPHVVGGRGSGNPGDGARALAGPRPAFPLQVARHLLVAMAAPAALSLSAPLTLALRTLRPPARRYLLAVLSSGVAGALTWAPVVLVLEIGGMYLYYLTPLYMLAEHVGWLHPFVHVHMFLAGCLLSWFLIGRDPLPTRPHTRTRLLVLFAAAGCHDLMAKLMYAHLLPRGAGPRRERRTRRTVHVLRRRHRRPAARHGVASGLVPPRRTRPRPGGAATRRVQGPWCPRGDEGYPNTTSRTEGTSS